MGTQNGHIVLFLESASLDKEEEVGNNNKKKKKLLKISKLGHSNMLRE